MSDALTRVLTVQREACVSIGSVVYGRLLQRCIDRAAGPGPVRDILAPHADDPLGSALALRFLGALHRIVLDGRAPDLAAHYPSAGGVPGPSLEDAFEVAVAEHRAELAARVVGGVQTNEVGRSASLLPGYLALARFGLPLRVREVGASAGLNLRWDRYRYLAGDAAFGPEDSPVRFVEPFAGPAPALDVALVVADRRGCDRAPIDPTTAEGRLSLRAFVWPDLVPRFERLDAALSVAAGVPATVDAADAPDWIERELAEPAPGHVTVVVHSIVLQYLDRGGRERFLRAVEDAGGRATAAAPVAWLRMEPGGGTADVRLTTWPGGEERLVATSAYHGPPVTCTG